MIEPFVFWKHFNEVTEPIKFLKSHRDDVTIVDIMEKQLSETRLLSDPIPESTAAVIFDGHLLKVTTTHKEVLTQVTQDGDFELLVRLADTAARQVAVIKYVENLVLVRLGIREQQTAD